MACLLSPFPLLPGASAKVNAAIVEFMVVTGTQWAQAKVAHGDGPIIHQKYISHPHTASGAFAGRSGCFVWAVVCRSFFARI